MSESALYPANAAFLAALNQGQMPAELIGEDGDAEGDVHIIDKSGEVHLRQCVRGEGEGGREGGRDVARSLARVIMQTKGLHSRAATTMGNFDREQLGGPVELSAMGLANSHTFHARADVPSDPFGKRAEDRLDRAVLVQSEEHWQDIRTEFESKTLRQPLPKRMAGGNFGENLLISGCSADDLCIGDKLVVVRESKSSKRKRARTDDGADALMLQITSPRRPCSKVDTQFGATWDGSGVRAYCARSGRAGFMVRVLTPGVLPEGCQLCVTERPNPRWTLSRVASLVYGMEGACDHPKHYTLPGFTHETASGVRGSGGGREAVLAKWKGTEAELRQLACLPELAAYEWKDEVQAMLHVVDLAAPAPAAPGWSCLVS